MTSRSTRSAAHRDSRDGAPAVSQRGMAIGYLAMVPLLAVYEAAIAHDGSYRNTAEIVLSLPLAFFAPHADAARRCALAICALWAGWSCFHSQLGLLPRVWRIVLEGALCAVILGPLLILLFHFSGIGSSAALKMPFPSTVPRLGDAARLVGGSAYEEIVFRIGAQSLFFLAILRLLQFLRSPEGVARAGAEVGAILAAACLFAAAHLSSSIEFLGHGGESFDAAIFTWRVLAGIMLSCIFRWRGPGVAAWSHGFFNLALLLGAGPDCFL
jgi:hypothetical protein